MEKTKVFPFQSMYSLKKRNIFIYIYIGKGKIVSHAAIEERGIKGLKKETFGGKNIVSKETEREGKKKDRTFELQIVFKTGEIGYGSSKGDGFSLYFCFVFPASSSSSIFVFLFCFLWCLFYFLPFFLFHPVSL